MRWLRSLYEWTMDRATHPHAEGWLALVAFVEASFFPIPPHPLLGLMCLAEPKKAIRFAAIATLASVAGGLLGYGIGALLYDTIGRQILDLLHLTESFPKAACYLREYGAEIIVIKGATPIPFKLVTITAGFIGMNIGIFLLASLISRSISFMIVGILFRAFGAPIKAFIDKYLGLVTVGFVAFVIGGFLLVALLDSGGSGEQDQCDTVTSIDQI
jgi:membrane protein YqaA with SNARE-associated domain